MSSWQDEVVAAATEAARTGEICDLTSRPEDEREVPAELIYHLCMSATGVHARGVRIRGALVIDPLNFDESRLRVPLALGESVLSCLRLVNASARSVQLPRSWIAEGPVRLGGATIEGQLSMHGANLTGIDTDNNALVADGMRVTGEVFLDEGFKSAGTVRLLGVSIEGQLSMRRANLYGIDTDGTALVADGLRVTGEVFLDGGFWSAGTLRLVNASCGVLYPGMAGALVLQGVRLGRVPMQVWEDQLKWIRRQPWDWWSPDPYEQVAATYLRSGDEESARQIRIARYDDELRYLSETQRAATRRYRFWRRALGVLVGYGYKRYRAGWALVATIFAAAAMFGWADHNGAMVPTAPPEDAESCGVDYPCFNAVVYGADVVLPIIDFGQDSAWRPVNVDAATPVAGLDPGGWWVTARWVFIALGWTLATVFVAAFTSIVQRP